MLVLYSIKLTFIVLGAIGLYTLVRLVLYRPLHQTTEEMIQAVISANDGKISKEQAIKAIQEDYKKNPENYM